MALYIIGLGLLDEKDITLKGLEAVQSCDKVYLESYTSRLACPVEDMESLYGKRIITADREIVESEGDSIVDEAKDKNVSFLVIGDPFCATTHNDLILRAKEKNVEVKVIHNASVINAVGETGLDLYKFGRITSIPFDNEHVFSPVEVINSNLEHGLSTLVLLDLDPKNNLYMTVSEALDFLQKKGLDKNIFCVGCAGIGSGNPEIFLGKLSEVRKKNFSLFPQCVVVPGKMHFMEEEILNRFKEAFSS
ncbi:MAG: diphthine synthase [Nanoarchaeota archaeon]